MPTLPIWRRKVLKVYYYNIFKHFTENLEHCAHIMSIMYQVHQLLSNNLIFAPMYDIPIGFLMTGAKRLWLPWYFY